MSRKQQTSDSPQKPASTRTAKKSTNNASKNQATVEEFDREGLGVSPKE